MNIPHQITIKSEELFALNYAVLVLGIAIGYLFTEWVYRKKPKHVSDRDKILDEIIEKAKQIKKSIF